MALQLPLRLIIHEQDLACNRHIVPLLPCECLPHLSEYQTHCRFQTVINK